ncbi:inner-membrane translocator [Jeotgalibacillus sp. R-1-5s-1]|uniref:inner-membrane translocator n=1 Tax=Jeotgalibacillus sp. R-1-5s-1 TaxID=2555897 RepID=UPI001069142F|nr:inner-membrane translocator [Jeotgalibacillus sp. R-1-5s-1]TFD94355.1 inner-membrane translocator [Jeotgalibacillus sp. R-1-5s-1]
MAGFILILFLFIIIALNILFFVLFHKGKLNLIVSGILMMLMAPVIQFTSSSLLLRYYDWGSGSTGEGAGYGAALLAILAFVNGLLILVAGIIRWLFTFGEKAK